MNSHIFTNKNGNTLMSFHEHCPIDCLLILRQSHLYCDYSLSKFKDLVNTHVYIG